MQHIVYHSVNCTHVTSLVLRVLSRMGLEKGAMGDGTNSFQPLQDPHEFALETIFSMRHGALQTA